MKIDHVIVVTPDLDNTVARYRQELGFETVAGGSHESVGTANSIIPFGPLYPQYLELLTATDPSLLFGEVVHKSSTAGETPFGWAVSVDNLKSTASRLNLEPITISREMPDSTVLSWQLVGLVEAVTSNGFLPFFISPQHDPLHARNSGGVTVQHRVEPFSIASINVSGSQQELNHWLGDAKLPVKVTPGEPHIVSFTINSSAGDIIISSTP